MLEALQLSTKIFLTIFFASIVTFYLLSELITYYSILVVNLSAQHTGWIIIINKDFLYIK